MCDSVEGASNGMYLGVDADNPFLDDDAPELKLCWSSPSCVVERPFLIFSFKDEVSEESPDGGGVFELDAVILFFNLPNICVENTFVFLSGWETE